MRVAQACRRQDLRHRAEPWDRVVGTLPLSELSAHLTTSRPQLTIIQHARLHGFMRKTSPLGQSVYTQKRPTRRPHPTCNPNGNPNTVGASAPHCTIAIQQGMGERRSMEPSANWYVADCARLLCSASTHSNMCLRTNLKTQVSRSLHPPRRCGSDGPAASYRGNTIRDRKQRQWNQKSSTPASVDPQQSIS